MPPPAASQHLQRAGAYRGGPNIWAAQLVSDALATVLRYVLAPSACDRARCGDVCLLNDQGGYTCACSAGKKLNHDKHTCTGN